MTLAALQYDDRKGELLRRLSHGLGSAAGFPRIAYIARMHYADPYFRP